jgi:hypothetical protein
MLSAPARPAGWVVGGGPARSRPQAGTAATRMAASSVIIPLTARAGPDGRAAAGQGVTDGRGATGSGLQPWSRAVGRGPQPRPAARGPGCSGPGCRFRRRRSRRRHRRRSLRDPPGGRPAPARRRPVGSSAGLPWVPSPWGRRPARSSQKAATWPVRRRPRPAPGRRWRPASRPARPPLPAWNARQSPSRAGPAAGPAAAGPVRGPDPPWTPTRRRPAVTVPAAGGASDGRRARRPGRGRSGPPAPGRQVAGGCGHPAGGQRARPRPAPPARPGGAEAGTDGRGSRPTAPGSIARSSARTAAWPASSRGSAGRPWPPAAGPPRRNRAGRWRRQGAGKQALNARVVEGQWVVQRSSAHLCRGSVLAVHPVTPPSGSRRWRHPGRSASRRNPRWVSTRTVPGRLPMSSATRWTSSPATDPEHDRLGLIGGQGRHLGQGGPGREPLDGVGGRVVRGGLVAHAFERRVLGRPAGGPAAPVEHLVAGDGEHPGPERRLAAREAGEPADHPQPGLGGQVLGGGRRRHREVAQQPGLEGRARAARTRPRPRRPPRRARPGTRGRSPRTSGHRRPGRAGGWPA